MKLAGKSHRKEEKPIQDFGGKPQGNKSFKTIRKWEINNEMDCK